MGIYSIQHFMNGEWRHFSAVKAHPDRSTVIERFDYYMELWPSDSTKARSREYRLAHFKYGGCRHLVNPHA